MKITKRIFYLFITLAVVGVLVTSCERDIIIEEDVDGFKEIIIEEDIDGFKTIEDVDGSNLRKGKKIILLKPKLLKEYINILSTKRKLSKKALKDAILNVSMEELQRDFSLPQLQGGVIIIPFNPVIPIFGQPCGYTVNTSGDPDNPDNGLNMDCGCQGFNFELFEDALGDYLSDPSYENCVAMGSAQCNVIITDGNCGGGPVTDCTEAYGVCP